MILNKLKYDNYSISYFVLLFITNSINVFVQSQRMLFLQKNYLQVYLGICELQGTCFRCEHNRYSFYLCHKNDDCYENEYCNEQQFCCPINLLSSQIEESATIMPNNYYHG